MLCVLATFERELLFCVVLHYIVLLILIRVKKCFPVADLRIIRCVARRALHTLK